MKSSATHEYMAYRNAQTQEQQAATTTTTNPPRQTNAYQAILNSSLPEPEKEPARLAQEILTLLVGGSATSSRVMTRITYHLTSEPAMLARLCDELITVMPDPYTTPPLEQLEKLPYLVSFFYIVSKFSSCSSSSIE